MDIDELLAEVERFVRNRSQEYDLAQRNAACGRLGSIGESFARLITPPDPEIEVYRRVRSQVQGVSILAERYVPAVSIQVLDIFDEALGRLYEAFKEEPYEVRRTHGSFGMGKVLGYYPRRKPQPVISRIRGAVQEKMIGDHLPKTTAVAKRLRQRK